MIDIHSHILPGVDDGSCDLEHSISMAKQAVVQGIHSVIATPHHENGKFANEIEFVELRVKLFREELEKRNIPLCVLAGQEVRVYRGLIEDIEVKRTSTLNGSRYMLLELPSDRISIGTHELLHELSLMNIVPIIAHPERNREIAENPLKLLELIQLGALSQITAHSLTGSFGKSIQTFSLDLCKNHLSHFISSDAHNTTNRGFALAGAYDILQEKLGIDIVNTFQNNANSIIHDLEIERYQPVWGNQSGFSFGNLINKLTNLIEVNFSMTMKKKVTVTTLAASVMFASIAGLPLSEKGLASKLGFTVSVASANTVLDQLDALHAELARDAVGLASVNSVKQYVKDHPITDKNLQHQLTAEVWDNIKNNAPTLQYSAVAQLINALDLFLGDSNSIDSLIQDENNRAAISLLFTSVGLPGIDEPDGLKKSDIIAFQQAALDALNSKKDELLAKVAEVIVIGGAVDTETIKKEINDIVTKDVIEAHSDLLISKLLNKYGITLGDLNAVQNRIANYVDAQSNSTIAKDARTAVESAGLRYLLGDRIKYSKSNGSTSSVELPALSVTYNNQEYPLPSNLLNWSAIGSGIKYDGMAKAFVLTGTTQASAKIEARDTKMGLLLYISKDAITLSPSTSNPGPSTGGGGGGGGGVITPPATSDPTKPDFSSLLKELNGATEARKQEIFKEAQTKVENTIKQLATLDLKSLIKVQGDTAKPQLNVSELVSKLKNIAAQAKALNEQLKALNPDAKEVKVQLTLNFGAIDAKTTEIPLAKELLEAAIANGIDTIAISMNGLSLVVSPAEFGADTTLKVTNQDTSVATSVTQLPVASGVYEFEFASGGSKVTSFNKPVEVTIPVPNSDKFDTELLSLAKIVDGKLEFYGGSYANGAFKGVRNSFSTYTVVENQVSFEDTASVKAWAGRQIQVAAAKGILEGRAENAFDPNGFVTRAEFAKMIVKTFALENGNATENFDDVNDTDWYKVYVASAVKNGIVNGKEAGKFDPNGKITRAEMAVMSSRALSLKGVSITPTKVDEALKGFTDSNEINSSLKNGVALAASEGIIIGEEGNVFNPNANSTRAQAAVVIYRLLNK